MGKGNTVIAGTYPPPIGGVTIHTIRLSKMLKSIDKNKCLFVDLRPVSKLRNSIHKKKYIKSIIGCLKNSKKGVLHYQLNNWMEASFLSIGSKIFGVKMVYTVHSFRIEEFSLIKRLCFRITSNLVSSFIAPSVTTKEKLISYNVKESKVILLNTYLPPTESELNAPVPKKIEEFAHKSKYLILANASRIYRDANNTDVYGLDMCIDLCANLQEVSFLFCVPIIEDEVYFNECLKKIKSLGIENRFMILNQDVSLVSLFKCVDLFVRPTSTDSFGVSIAEALSCKVPSIASDVCERANGTILFKTRNLEDFIEKVKSCMERPSDGFTFKDENNIEAYVSLYEKHFH